MKKLSSLLAAVLMVALLSTHVLALTTVGSPDFDVYSEGVYLYNIDTDTLIWEKNGDKQMYPASLTKIMTCILALEYIEKNNLDLDSEIVTYPDYVQDYLYRYQLEVGDISLGGLMAGEQLSMRDMLYALMLRSANEAAMCIADHIGGSQEGFADMMNARARELGATNTNFINPNGLFEAQQYTTPHDMALISLHAMELPGFMDIVTTTSYTAGPTNLHESLTWSTTILPMVEGSSYYYPYLSGIKTGTLPESGYNLISTATRDGFTYLLVVMGGPLDRGDQNVAFTETASLYDWVFREYRRKSLVEKDKVVQEIPLRLSSEQDFLKLMTAERFTALVPQSIEASSVTMRYNIPDSWDAPVKKHDEIGTVTLMLAGEEIGEVALLAAETVDASPVLVFFDKIRGVMRSFWFKFVVIFIILIIVVYVVLMVMRNRNRRRKGGYRPRRRI